MITGQIPLRRDHEGNFFLDRDPAIFKYILDFLRSSKVKTPFFVQNLASYFSNDELHILKRRNLQICEHSSFCQLLNKNIFNRTLKTRFLMILVGDV